MEEPLQAIAKYVRGQLRTHMFYGRHRFIPLARESQNLTVSAPDSRFRIQWVLTESRMRQSNSQLAARLLMLSGYTAVLLSSGLSISF